MSEKHTLYNISPLDGRYSGKTKDLQSYFSESSLINYRLLVESRWLLHLSERQEFGLELTANDKSVLLEHSQLESIPPEAALRVKEIESVTNHDVKACEYYLREVLTKTGSQERTKAFIHFACTSEDINNTSYALMMRDGLHKVLLPAIQGVEDFLATMAQNYRATPMLSRTHGQTASPTTLGKELGVFVHRLRKVSNKLTLSPVEAKINGAVGNFNAHADAYPDVDWFSVSKSFIEDKLGLSWNPVTTQIENHDSICHQLDLMKHWHGIAIGLCRDIWTYISLGYFGQKVKEGEVGSSTMPHKVNPIDFENAEGNFGVANGLISHLSEKLLISRMQRDLTDSTVLRTLGTVLGHSLIALKSLDKGLHKLKLNEERIAKDLDQAWEVLAEPLQTVLRARGVVDAYENLKKATRGRPIDKAAYMELVDTLEGLEDRDRERFKKLTPALYVGKAAEVVDHICPRNSGN